MKVIDPEGSDVFIECESDNERGELEGHLSMY